MSAVHKRLERRDAFISPYTAHKTFTFTSSSFTEVGIELRSGVSGSFPYDEKALVYAGTKHILDTNLDGASIEYHRTSSIGKELNVISIPRSYYGDAIKPGSIKFDINSASIADDNGYLLSGSTKVGYADYSKGLLVFTSEGYEGENIFNSSSTEYPSFSHQEIGYALITHSIQLSPNQGAPSPFQAGSPDPTSIIILESASYNFTKDFIVGAPDVLGAFPNNPNLGPRLTLTQGGISSDHFASLIDDQTPDQLTLTFPQEIVHPIVGPVDLSKSSLYAQFDSIRLEWKKSNQERTITSHIFKGSGSWGSEASLYPQSSSNFTIIDNYTAQVPEVNLIEQRGYLQSISRVKSREVEFTSSSIDVSYFPGDGSLSFKSTKPILTHNYHCIVEPNEFNLSHNPSLIDKSNTMSGSLKSDFVNDDFRVYTTTIGLYNDFDELVAIGKLSEPTPMLPDTPYTFVVKLDF